MNYEEIFAASAVYQTRRFGEFKIMVALGNDINREHLVLVRGDVADARDVLCRVASRCVTSTALDASDCDCSGQIDRAMRLIDRADRGILIYLDQEGRGNGIVNKVKAMNGKRRGLDTFEAVEELGLPADNRGYKEAAQLIHALGPMSIALLTNNIEKLQALRDQGIVIADMIPCIAIDPPVEAQRHLDAKRARGHTL